MARKTSSRRGSAKTSKVGTRTPGSDKKRGGKNMSESVNDEDKDFESHEPDCQCYLRKCIFLPPGFDAIDGQEQDAKQKS